MSVEDMKDFIETFSAIPDDPKTPFIVAHELAQNEDGTYHLSVIISSHALIDLILKDPSDKLIQVDFTHNLSVDDFLVAMVGCPNDSRVLSDLCEHHDGREQTFHDGRSGLDPTESCGQREGRNGRWCQAHQCRHIQGFWRDTKQQTHFSFLCIEHL